MPAKSKAQQRLMGMVVKCQETGECPSEKIKHIAKSMTKTAAKDFAKTKHENLDESIISFSKYTKNNLNIDSYLNDIVLYIKEMKKYENNKFLSDSDIEIILDNTSILNTIYENYTNSCRPQLTAEIILHKYNI